MAWTDGEVSGAEVASIRAHVDSCAGCAALVDEFASLGARLSEWRVEPASFALPNRPAHPLRRFKWVAAACLAIALVGLPVWRWSSGRHVAGRPGDVGRNTALPGAAAGLAPSPAAKVTVTVFMDWLCPPCASSYPTYLQVVRDYETSAPDQVALVIRDFPLDSKCNAAVRRGVHPAACEAAAAVRIARARGRAEEMIRFFSAHVTSLDARAVRSAATDILGSFDFDDAYARELPEIRNDVSDGVARHVQFTPSVFVNDVPLASNELGMPTVEDLRAAIDAQLRRNVNGGCPDGRRRTRAGGCSQ